MTSAVPSALPLPTVTPGAPLLERRELDFADHVLRPLKQDESSVLYAAVIESLETVGKWMSWCHAGYQEEEAAAWITRASESWSRASAFEFGIFSCVDGTLHGVCGLNCIVWPNRVANLGYWIRQSAQGRGIASAAVKRLAQFGFEELGLTRIEIVTAEDNTGSRRVAERSGALFEAVLRNRLVVAGKPTPGALYSLIPSD